MRKELFYALESPKGVVVHMKARWFEIASGQFLDNDWYNTVMAY